MTEAMAIKRFGYGSAVNGRKLAEGCKHCMEGSKMVLLITGRCSTGCFYCPLSAEKKGKDVIYANERRVSCLEEIVAEAEAMDATGTGITGGDPLSVMERTVAAVSLLKQRFGKRHHIHLYTSEIDPEKAAILKEAGLDEIRFHPHPDMWERMDETRLAEVVAIPGLTVGIEVPAIPGLESALDALVKHSVGAGVAFVNINELEFSEGNWDMMERQGYLMKGELSSSVSGSEELALGVMAANRKAPVHFCSSAFKDGVQLRKRLVRRARRIAEAYDVVTEDGTLIRGVILADDPQAAIRMLAEEHDVPSRLMHARVGAGRVEIAPWILEDLADDLPFECYLSEEYASADRLEVERVPVGRRPPGTAEK